MNERSLSPWQRRIIALLRANPDTPLCALTIARAIGRRKADIVRPLQHLQYGGLVTFDALGRYTATKTETPGPELSTPDLH